LTKVCANRAETAVAPPLILETTPQFDRDVKRLEKRGRSLKKLQAVIGLLRSHQPLLRSHF
jgi:mRNA-degrading endonuclease YafQ of YafQ-DinJ toxin-antitoxin module